MNITPQDLIDHYDCNPKHVTDWMAYRKFKKKPQYLSESALKAMITSAENAGIDLPQAVKLCAENDWQGFRAHYLPKPQVVQQVAKTDREGVRDGLRDIGNTNW